MSLPWEIDDATRHNFSRTLISKVDDSKSQQMVDLTGRKYQKPEKVWRPQAHGFSSVPPKGTDGYIVAMGGRADRFLYVDGGHEKYRPKETPDGGSLLYNHSGDIFRVFKDKMEAVHSKNLILKVGKGNDVGQGTNASDAKNITVTMTGSNVVINFDNTSFKLESGKVTVTGPEVVVNSPNIKLGGAAAVQFIKLCDDSCSVTTKAI